MNENRCGVCFLTSRGYGKPMLGTISYHPARTCGMYIYNLIMQLIMKYFTFEELYRSETAERLDIKNEPSLQEKPLIDWNLQYLVNTILDPLREYMGCPIYVTSGYRCKELNRKVGGVPTSQHMKGEAADITIAGATTEDLLRMVQFIEYECNYDQLIIYREQRFLHVSAKAVGNRYETILK